MVRFRTRVFVRIISYCLFSFIVLSGLLWTCIYEKNVLLQSLSDVNCRAFSELLSDLEGLDTSLSKINYCTSQKQIALLSADIRVKADSAVSHLSLLPLSSDTCQKTVSYLNKVSSYSYYLSSSEITDEIRSTISSLSDCSHEIVASFSALSPYISADGFFSDSPVLSSDLRPSSLSGSMQLLEEAFPETPTLIYDGPFSDHVTQSTPLVNQEPLITRNDARKSVASFLGVPVEEIQNSGDTSGLIPTFGFTFYGQRALSIDVTCHGGHILFLSSDGDVSSSVLSSAEAVEKGNSFLKEFGYSDLTPSYFYFSGGVLYINYESTQNGIICYPDLVQLGISLEDGEILYLNAVGYLSNHRQRSLEASISEDEAVSLLSNQFSCQSIRLAVIPTDGKEEHLCWELSCSSGENAQFLYYINASTGVEEKILLLRESENGTLVS